jgi:hypothetical protein
MIKNAVVEKLLNLPGSFAPKPVEPVINLEIKFRMKITFPSIITSVCVALLFLATTAKASPCTNTVYNTQDSGPGSLRDALANATNFQTITFCPGVTGTIKLTSGQLAITKGVTIVGPGANVLALDGNGSSRVFYVSSSLPVSISGLTITNGYAAYPNTAGGIHNETSPLTLSNCVVTGNQGYYGGGICNSAKGGAGLLQIYNCTLSGNTANVGGALFNAGGEVGGNGVVQIYNSTISSNSVTYTGGGGLYNDGYDSGVAKFRIVNCTLSGNFPGSGIASMVNGSGSATVEIGSTILNATALETDGGTILSLGYNLSSDNGSGFLTATGDQINTDPMLGPLQLNGGQTPTHALLIGSPAIDAGTNFSGLATDQRGPGFGRRVDINLSPNVADGTDIGAFELQTSEFQLQPPAITSSNSATFITGYSNSFRILATGIPTPAIYATGTLPAGTGLSTKGILSGTIPLGSGGIYPLTVIASNGVSPVATQYLTLTVVEHGPCYTGTVANNQDSGPGSLRYALENATNFETITFCPGVTGTIKLTSGQLAISNGVTIVGPGANVLALDGNGSSRVFYVSSSFPVSISGLTITNGYATDTAGGIHSEQSPVTLSNCVVTGNQGASGGGIYNTGTQGGGLLQIYNCTLSGNRAGHGGALYNEGVGAEVHMYNSTISGNSSEAEGGAIFNVGYSTAVGTIKILNSTLSGNSSGVYGEGIFNLGGSATIDIGSTILNATALKNLDGTIQSLGYNLSSDDGSGWLTATGDQINTDPMLGPLQLNGGQSPTHALLSGSPAIDAGTNFSGLATDPRGPDFARTMDINGIPNVADGTDIGAFELQGPPAITSTNSVTFITGYSNSFRIVATGLPLAIYATGTLPAGIGLGTNGLLSGTPPLGSAATYPLTVIASNGIPPMATQYFTLTVVEHCNTVQNNQDSGPGSLRYALANATNFQTITFCPGVTGTIKLTSGQLTVDKGVTIVGPGANVLALDGNGSDRVFHVSSSLPVSISGLTITNGYAPGEFGTGGGIYNEQSPLTLSNCVVTGNYAHDGGGIYNGLVKGGELLELYNCTLSGNSAVRGRGGALENVVDVGGNPVVHIYNSTISSNWSDGIGGAIYNLGYGSATIRIVNSTLSGNSSGAYGDGIFNDVAFGGSATIDIGSTILNATALKNDGGTIQSLGYNLSSDNGGGFLTATGDKTNTNPLLGPLQLNGGQTPTHALLSGSPAIDAGTNFSGLATDQRGPGFARTVAINGIHNVADRTDIGAFELQGLVTTSADTGLGSLRQVAGVLGGGGTVNFAPNLSGQTITLTSGEIAITNNLTIDASALANGIIINGNHNSRIFNIASGVAVSLNALVLTNGYTTHAIQGGAIFNAGTLALNYCTLAGNSGDYTVAGGAIANQGQLTVLGCTFSGNSAGFSGAIDNRSTCTLKNSTFYGNVAFAGNGGAIDNPYGAVLSLLHCTFSGNSASSLGGAIDNYQAQVNVTNSILSSNSGQDIYSVSGSTINAGGANIISALANAGTVVGGGTISSADPMLGPLTNNGGRTLTMMPRSGSPAIDAGVTSLAVGLAYDQRGPSYPRVVGSAVDLGALEYKAPPVITSPSNVTFIAGLSNSFTFTTTGFPAPTIAVTGTFPAGVSFTPPATLSGFPAFGSGGIYPLTVIASNGVSPVVTQYFTLRIVEIAARPSFNTNGLGWVLNGDTVNGGPNISNNVFTLTDSTGGENRSGWFAFPLYVGAFEASFTYQDIGGNGADGVGFVIQNDPRGPNAIGLAGGGLAYAGITSSVAVLLNIYGSSGLMLGTNGVDAYYGSGAPSGKSYQSTAPVNLDMGNPIAVALRYTGGILHVSLTDTVTSANFQTNIPVNIPAFTGTNAAWVGITGSEGGIVSHQTVSNFSYVPLPTLLSNPGNGNMALSWPASIYGYHLQWTSDLLGSNWADLPVTITQANGFNLATVATIGNSQFFRLVLPPR